MSADLHAHTTASDGSLTPTELVRAAAALGLSHLAVTDHDTTAGVAEAMEAAGRAGIRLVPGVELSAEGPPGKCHLLGLGIDPDHPGLTGVLADLSEKRRTRNARIAERLRELGVPITLEEVTAVAPPGANVGRPHFAQTLVAKGAVASVAEAFEHFLAEGASAYLPKAVLAPADAIRLIHEAGGLAFLAHPGLLRLAPDETPRARIAALRALGLDGVEAFYPKHTAAQVDAFQTIAGDLGLLVTGGSDFHGVTKPDMPLGVVINGGGVSVELIAQRFR